MPAETVAFADYEFEAYLTSSGLNARLNALKNALNAHAGEIDAMGAAPSSSDINPKDYGAVGDGLSHPLSTVYGSLAAAQAVYPFVTALTQELDWAAFKKAADAAFGAYGAENADTNAHLNKVFRIPAGKFIFGNDTLLIRNASGINMIGAGKRASIIYGNNVILGFDGLWYSHIRDFSLQKTATNALPALDIDGNVPGHPYATRGVQGNHFSDMFVDGLMSDYTVAMCRQGSSGGQGSENLFHNIHLSSAAFACYFQSGYNALNNTFIGGNMQGYNTNGIYLIAGQITVISMGFQSTTGYTQVVNDGWDINCSSGGVVDKILVLGCRTESLRFYKGAGSQIPFIAAVNGNPSLYIWTAGAAVALNTAIVKSIGGKNVLLRVTTAGVSAGAEPAWNATGTTNDGTAVWTATVLDFINIAQGTVDGRTVQTNVGRIIIEAMPGQVEVSANYTVQPGDCNILVDTTAGGVTITLPADNDAEWPSGKKVTITKYGNDANVVTVVQADGGYPGFVPNSANLAGGSRGSVTMRHLGGGSVGRRWMLEAKVTW